MSLAAGTQLGPYEILAPIGAGGMGEVYKARDTRLDRIVAIKISQEQFSERFEREARAVAALNHPHICQLFDVGPNYLVMEFVEGEPIQGPLPVGKAVEYASQILEALNAAHRKGIVHRDLKPANILLTKQGIKLLDFGLAKQSGPLDETDVTRALTQQGQIVGTLQYMSPEQLQGKEADARSDLFAFGCVLYEMLTGKQAFEGKSAASVIAAILERDPTPLNLSPPLQRVIQTCLAKDPDHRFQNALDVKRDLIWALEQPAAVKANRRAWIAAVAAALILGSIGGGWAVSHRRKPADSRVVRFQIAPPEGGAILGGGNLGGGFAISPDGQSAAFIGVVHGKTGLWVRPLDAANARMIRGSEGANRPFWSPDSGSIAFSAGGVLQRVDLAREAISKICDVPGVYWGGTWSGDGRILFVSRDLGIFQVPALGGAPAQVTTLDQAHGEGNHVYPQVLPSGRFLYTITGTDSTKEGVYAASIARPAEKVRLLTTPSQALYVSNVHGEDHLLWIRDRTLVAQRFDAGTLQLIGEPRLLADPVGSASSGNQVLLYGSVALRQFKWFDRKGNAVGLLGEPGPWAFSRISPDGRRVAATNAGNNQGVWLMEIDRGGVASRLTSSPGLAPVWSPEGRTILFSGTSFISRINVDGAGGEERVTLPPNRKVVHDWSRDGRFILYNEAAQDTGRDLWVLPVTPEGRPSPGAKPWPFVRDRFDQTAGRFSPDTRWVAYQADDSGQFEVYVRSFPQSREKLRISTGGGHNPQWGVGGRELFYVSRDGKLMLVRLTPLGTGLEASLPQELFALPASVTSGPNPYEVASDGERFLVSDIAASQEPLTVIVNWPTLLKKGAAGQ